MFIREARPAFGVATKDFEQPKAPLWLLSLLVFCGTLAIHIFVPALPRAAEDLGVGASSMQMTVSLYILGLAFGQLVYGPLSDQFGRRPVLIGGVALYTVAGLVAAMAPNITLLIIARIFQAFGGCAGLVLARAIIRDTSESERAAGQIALMNLMITIGPGVAPLIGSALVTALGWRSIFIVLSAVGVVCIFLTALLLPETSSSLSRVNFSAFARSNVDLLISPTFIAYAVGGGCATTSIYAFITAAPFIFVNYLNRPMQEVGFYLALVIFGISIGSILSKCLTAKISISRLLVPANFLSVVAAFVFLTAVLFGFLSVGIATSTMFVFSVGVGIAGPMALVKAVSVNPLVIGSASGLYGFTQMAIGAACAELTAVGGNPTLAAAIVLFATGIIAQTAFYIAQHRQKSLSSAESF